MDASVILCNEFLFAIYHLNKYRFGLKFIQINIFNL